MNEPKLIGIAGRARSGKDTTADFIQGWCDLYNISSARESFARRLKESAAHALGVFEDEVEFCNKLKGDYERGFIEVRIATKESGPNKVVARVTGREYLQYYGTEAHRQVFGDDFWVDAVLPVTRGNYGRRYEEETYGEVSSAGLEPLPDWWGNFRVGSAPVADVCLITDCRFPNEARRIKELGGVVWRIDREGSGAGNHASEQDLDGELIDLVIDNNGTLADLDGSITVAMEEISGLTAVEEALFAETEVH